jgi:uncharacterized protein YjiS (DUF1127 family)
MCTHTDESTTNHRASLLLAQIGDTLHVWRQRQLQRRELLHWTERDFHDAGLCRSDVVYEAEKPFWRA